MKKTVIINIGLETGIKYGVKEPLTLRQVINAVDYYSNNRWDKVGHIEACKVVQSNTEGTAVITFRGYVGLKELFEQVALKLKQEAIAYYVIEEQKGYLVGEYVEEWGGVFKAEYFLI